MGKEEYHWADQIATDIINKREGKKEYIVATGVTPSGTLHIGNFRELITGDFILKALKKKGKKAIHYHYWDDYDVFRKAPKNMPKQGLLRKNLRKCLIAVPDVVDNKHKSFPEHNEKQVEKYLPIVEIKPKIIRQCNLYKKSFYAEEMKTALDNVEEIKKILNKFRKEDLKDDWLPISVYCEKCYLEAKKIEYRGDYKIYYECSCGNKDEFDFRKKGLSKLKWRVQWPAWWHHMKVDFESAGKDHFAAGGSVDTGKMIQEKIYKSKPPLGFCFGWISIKGGGQFSSSKGTIITLKETLGIYEPSIVRWLFAGSRPSTEFAISFDLDVLKIYEDFDKTERIYFGKEKIENEKKRETEKRNYELSAIKMPKKMPLQPSFRHLTTLIQIFDYDKKRVMNEFKAKNEFDKDRLKIRIECAINWLEKYAPEQMKFEVQKDISSEIKKKLDDKQKKAIKLLNEKLNEKKYDEKELFEEIYEITKKLEIKPKQLFKAAYLVLLKKERGPRLAPFLITLGNKAKNLFSKL